LAASLIFHAAITARLNDARAINAELIAGRPAVEAEPATLPGQRLRAFESSHLVGLLREGAAVADVSIDEMSFSVEGAPSQPFVRYRAVFDVTAPYPAIRKFISHILGGSDGVVLDTVSCARKDLAAADVKCDLSVFVAYRRGERG
jgi:hypothetical protein